LYSTSPTGCTRHIRGAYVVVDRPGAAGAELAARLLAGPTAPTALQLRLKRASTAELLATARAVGEVTRVAGALFIVNDRLDVALAAGAGGVHLGQDDLSVADARRITAAVPGFVLGVSTHDLEQVANAIAGGADYVGYGPVFPTTTKVNRDPVQGLAALAAAVQRAGPVPVVAIGGITLDRAAAVAATGAAAACAISAVNGAPNPAAAARALNAPWQSVVDYLG